MTTITYSQPRHKRGRLTVMLRAVKGATASAATRVVSPHRAALKNLASIPLTVAGTGCVDFAAFHLAHGWGWLVTGLSLVALEHLIADEVD